MSINPSLFTDHLLIYLTKSKLIQTGQHVLVAVSGGSDSMALLYALVNLQEKFDLTLTVGHINHNLRKSAASDEKFVNDICNKLDIQFRSDLLNPPAEKFASGLEEWARIERYASLQNIRNEVKADLIATAHHGNDQVETILFRLARGTGIMGLSGIKDSYDCIIRPFLPFSKSIIMDYVESENIPFIEDETNADLHRSRNFIRHRVVEDWESETPGLVKNFYRMSQHSNELFNSLNDLISPLAAAIVKRKSEGILQILKSDLDKYSTYLKIMLITNALSGKIAERWTLSQWESAKLFILSSTTGSMHILPNNWIILNDRDNWIIRRSMPHISNPISIAIDQTINLDGFTFSVKRSDRQNYKKNDQTCELIDFEKIENKKLVIRTWRKGDSFRPLGMQGTKKISDFLIDRKLDRFSKIKQLLLTADEEIVWVCGQQISDSVKITEKTNNFVELSLNPMVGG